MQTADSGRRTARWAADCALWVADSEHEAGTVSARPHVAQTRVAGDVYVPDRSRPPRSPKVAARDVEVREVLADGHDPSRGVFVQAAGAPRGDSHVPVERAFRARARLVRASASACPSREPRCVRDRQSEASEKAGERERGVSEADRQTPSTREPQHPHKQRLSPPQTHARPCTPTHILACEITHHYARTTHPVQTWQSASHSRHGT